jgi:hypothetical protein
VTEVSSDDQQGLKDRKQDYNRVKSRLKVACGLSRNADYLAYELHGGPWELIRDIDAELKRKWQARGGLLGGVPDYKTYARNPQELRKYAAEAMENASLAWRQLQTDEEKEIYINFVFEHDKGYNRILEFSRRWKVGERPEIEEAPDLKDVKQEKGSGYDTNAKTGREATQSFGAIATTFRLSGDIRNGMNGGWRGRILYNENIGSIQLTGWDPNARTYKYIYLGRGKVT